MPEFMEIYESMLGLLEPEAQLPWVENAFEAGTVCDQAYEDMRMAYERLCQRLSCQNNDSDLDIMVAGMEQIQKELCRRMYYLGRSTAYIQENA